MRILALDIASNCGWAISPGPTQRWAWGVRSLPSKAPLPAAFCFFEDWLHKKIAETEPDGIAIEKPIMPGRTGFHVLRKLYGLTAVAEAVAWDRRIPHIMVQSATVRKHFCGTGRAKKPDVIRSCRERGFMVHDDNEADAVALAHYAMHHAEAYDAAA